MRKPGKRRESGWVWLESSCGGEQSRKLGRVVWSPSAESSAGPRTQSARESNTSFTVREMQSSGVEGACGGVAQEASLLT